MNKDDTLEFDSFKFKIQITIPRAIDQEHLSFMVCTFVHHSKSSLQVVNSKIIDAHSKLIIKI